MAWRQAELNAVVGQYRVDFVWDGFDERDEEGRSSDAIGFLDKLNEGELRRAVDGDEKVELSLGGLLSLPQIPSAWPERPNRAKNAGCSSFSICLGGSSWTSSDRGVRSKER